MALMQHLMHIYLFGVSINRMLILQLKIFLSVKFAFTLILYVILLLCDLAVDVCIIQMFTIFTAATPLTYIRFLLKMGY